MMTSDRKGHKRGHTLHPDHSYLWNLISVILQIDRLPHRLLRTKSTLWLLIRDLIWGLSSLLVGLLIGLLIGLLVGLQPTYAAPNPIRLTLWHGVNPPENREVLQKLVDRFNVAHPEIQVESLYVGQGDQQIPKILAAVVGNAPPNLLWYAPTLTGQLIELEAIEPLDNWWSDFSGGEAVDPALRSSMEWEDRLWSIPFSTNNVGIFYRPSLFAAAGITELPHTWGELRQVAQTLTNPAEGKYGMLLPLGKGEWTVFMWLPFLWSAGGEIGADHLVSPAATQALQFWKDLLDDRSAILSPPERGYELEAFLSGKVAMQLTGPWTLRPLQQSGVDFSVMPIPSQRTPATSIGGENLFLFKTNPAEEQAALQFMEYVLSEDFQTTWAIETGYLPVNLASRQSQTYRNFVAQQSVIQVFLDQAKYGRSRPIFPGYSRLSDALGRAIESVLLDRATPETALQKAEKRLEF
ncbi:ABC transporter substrate-binding protein [Leptolyngbya ohadii]|uniref:ABC transporter substrate-binding protein n=1 Tax=Leptolyngbya ohadii TaxID=1962290 RepID=UPI001CEDA722|nr:ABC transporter substrate-binding protein [Leptolyngbya ohadii]